MKRLETEEIGHESLSCITQKGLDICNPFKWLQFRGWGCYHVSLINKVPLLKFDVSRICDYQALAPMYSGCCCDTG